MKTLLRYFLINFASLWIATRYIPGIYVDGGITTMVKGTFVFMVINWLMVPILKLLFLPLNLLTLGLFAWVINVIALYLLTTIITGFKIASFNFPGYFSNGFNLPPIEISAFWTAVIASFVIGAVTNFLRWLSH